MTKTNTKLRWFAWLKANDPDRLKEIRAIGGKHAAINGKAQGGTAATSRAASIKAQFRRNPGGFT